MQPDQLTRVQLEHRLGVTQMTLFLWRKGNEHTPPIPSLEKVYGKERHTILYPFVEVENWLKEYRPHLVEKLRTNTCDCKLCERGTKAASGNTHEREREPKQRNHVYFPIRPTRDSALPSLA